MLFKLRQCPVDKGEYLLDLVVRRDIGESFDGQAGPLPHAFAEANSLNVLRRSGNAGELTAELSSFFSQSFQDFFHRYIIADATDEARLEQPEAHRR